MSGSARLVAWWLLLSAILAFALWAASMILVRVTGLWIGGVEYLAPVVAAVAILVRTRRTSERR